MARELTELAPRILDITFGDVFEHKVNGNTRIFVVTDVDGPGNSFQAGMVKTLEDGQESLNPGGAIPPEDVEVIIDHWDLDRVKRALGNHYRAELPGDFIEYLVELSKKPSRTIIY